MLWLPAETRRWTDTTPMTKARLGGTFVCGALWPVANLAMVVSCGCVTVWLLTHDCHHTTVTTSHLVGLWIRHKKQAGCLATSPG